MPRRHQRAEYQQLSSEERERILELHELGLSMRAIASRVGRDVSTIQRCVARWTQDHLRTRQRGSGSSRCTSDRTDRHIRRMFRGDPFATASHIQTYLPLSEGASVSCQTIRNRLHEAGMRARRPATGVPLTTRHRAARLAWCRRYRHWRNEWHRVLFSDESRFCLWRNDGRGHVWRLPGERYLPAHIVDRHTGPTPGFMVWGGIMFGQRTTLVHITGSLTSGRYVTQVVMPVVRPLVQAAAGTLFQQDNARPHVARHTLNSLNGIDILPWPAASPDLSPIEHVWAAIGRVVHRAPQPHTVEELRAAVDSAWQAISQETINSLIDSMPRRLEACIAARGGHIAY